MKVAFFFMDCHPFGHSRRLIEELLRLCGGDGFCFYIKPEAFHILPDGLLKGREIVGYRNYVDALSELNRRKDVDAIVVFDLYDSFVDQILEVDFHKEVIFYNAAANLLLAGEKLRNLAFKGYTFLWEHEVAYHIAKSYISPEGAWGVLPYPIPSDVNVGLDDPIFDLSFPGSFEERKGASVFLFILPDLLDAGMMLRASLLGHERAIGELAKYRGRLSLKEEPDASQSEFIRELASSKVVLFAYDPYEHSFAGSGILRECMFYGIPVLATEGSLLSYHLSKLNGAWIPLKSRIDKEALLEAVMRAIQGYDELKRKALSAKERVQDESSSLSFLKRLLGFIGKKGEDKTFDIPEDILRRAESFFFFSKANITYRRYKIEEADREVDRALSMDSGYWRALFLKSDILSSKGRYEEALSLLELAEANPLISPLNKAYSLVKRAIIFEKVGRRSQYLQAIDRIRGLRSYLSSRSVEELFEIPSLKDSDLILEILSDSEDYFRVLKNRNYRVRFLLESIYISLLLEKPIDFYVSRLWEEANLISFHEEALFRTDPLRIKNLFDKTFALLSRHGDRDSARKLLDIFVKLFGRFASEDPLYIYNLASLCEKVGELDEAERLFKEALSKGFYNKAGIYFHLGEIALKRGDKKTALEYYSLCLKHEPGHGLAFNRLKELEGERDGV